MTLKLVFTCQWLTVNSQRLIHIITLTLITFFTIPISRAQTSLITDLVDPAQQNEDILYGSDDTFVGSRFLYDDFQVGAIRLLTGQVIDKLLIRYNAFDDLVHFKTMKSDKENIVKSAMIAGFSFYVPDKEQVHEFRKIGSAFYRIIADTEQYSVLKRHGKRFIVGAPSNGYNTAGNSTLDRLTDTESYHFCEKPDWVLTEFTTQRSDLYNLLIQKGIFPDKTAIKNHIKEHRINVKTDEGLAKLVGREGR